jgi:hypothetical protein
MKQLSLIISKVSQPSCPLISLKGREGITGEGELRRDQVCVVTLSKRQRIFFYDETVSVDNDPVP